MPEKNLRIAMVTDSFYPTTGGSETAIRELSNTLSDMGHTVVVFGVFPEVRSPPGARFSTVRIDSKIGGIDAKLFGDAYALHREIKRFAPDVINAHFMLKSGFLGVAVGKKNGIPTVVSVRGKCVFYEAKTIKEKVLFYLYRKTSLMADVMLATSAEMADMVFMRWGRRPMPLSNGVDIRHFTPGRATDLRGRLGLREKKIIFCVRRFVPKNGIEYIVRAMPSILAVEPNAILLLAGPKVGQYEKLRILCEELGIAKSVCFLGALDHQILPDYFAIADVVVQPSIAEARSLSCLEAMASGCAIIATATGGLAELIRHEENGYLIPAFEDSTYYVATVKQESLDHLRDAVLRIFSDTELRNRIKIGARATAEENSWERIAKQSLALYRDAIGMHDPQMRGANVVKAIYKDYSDKIVDKRYNSPNILRRYVHRAQYQSVIDQIRADETVIDAGCGEGVLSCLLAKEKGVRVIGIDISEPNIERAKQLAKEMQVEHLVEFRVGDAEHLPVPDASCDVVVSSHVLEHLPDFDQGVRELARVSRSRAIVALPTIANMCSWVQVGHGSFWELSKRSLAALPWGFLRTLGNLFREGVDEGYGGNKDLVHIFRFPWVARRRLSSGRFDIVHVEASTLAGPFFPQLLPLIRRVDRARTWPILRWCGYGTTFVLRKAGKAEEA